MSADDRFHRLEPAWLDGALRRAGHTGAAVIAVTAEDVAFTGATTDLARLSVSYGTGEPGPATMVAKLCGTKDVQRQMDAAMGLFDREARFYTELATQVPVRTPSCYAVGDGAATPLLLEDLAAQRQGDQVAGMTLADAEATLDALADLHAAFWESDVLAKPWLASPAEGVFAGMIVQLVASGAPALAERFADRAEPAVLAAVVEQAPNWGHVLARCAEGPQTLVHNDARLDNLFFADDGAPCFIDWQLLARTRGTQDVGNLLAGSMNGDDLAAHWERLLRRYHDRLLDGGVTGYSFDHCVEHYRQNVLYPLGAGLALLGAMAIDDGRGLGERIVERCLRHVADLDSFKAL